MRTVTITVGTGAQGVTIGRRAENEATAVIFDVSALIETYGDGGAVLMVKRPTDADAYPATVERSGASVTWTPTETDLAYKGMGEAELFWYVDGMLAKTAVYTINIRRDIGETTGEAPAPYDDWIATLTELGGQTAENAQRAEVARAAAETAAATATSAANTANTAAERAESAANNAEQDAASTAADRTAAEDAAARAATSATAAATSASVAETSATQAGVSANSAAASATSAAQSASDAQSAVASIGDSVTRAESAASTATSAAQTASTKASEANTSAGTAAQNATTATVKAQEAAQSAIQAAQSATAAQTAQTAAEAAQTGAQTAQTAAESAAASAEEQADRAEGYADRLIDVYPTDTASGSIASFSDGADGVEIKSATVQIVPKQAGTGDPSPDNVRPISGWDAVTVYVSPTTDPEDATTYPLTLPSTVYGGQAVYNGGGLWTVTSDMAIAVFDGSADEAWTIANSNTHYRGYTYALTDIEPLTGYAVITSAICDKLKSSTWDNIFNGLLELGQTAKAIGFGLDSLGITTVSDLNGWLAANPLTIVYPLATPQTFTVTTEQLLTSLKGQNNIWADCGDTSVTYRADIGLFIDKKLAALAAALS